MKIVVVELQRRRDHILYELPPFVTYKDIKFAMTSPANLMRALNRDGQRLNDIFDIGDNSAKIHRRVIWVVTSTADRLAYDQQRKFALNKKRSTRSCAICGKECKRSRHMFGTCSDVCRLQNLQRRNQIVKQNHWCKSERASEIAKQRIKTRQENDVKLQRVYVPWNKDKHGIYSIETLRKISDAALKQFSMQCFRKTSIEAIYENILKSLDVEFTYSYIFCRHQFDFYLPTVKTFVEVHGDFWHGNPVVWGTPNKPLRDHQRMKQINDDMKKNLVENCGYTYVSFWESDIHNNVNDVIEKTREMFK